MSINILCVSLVGSTERREIIDKQISERGSILARHQVTFRYFDATLGSSLDVESKFMINEIIYKSKSAFRRLGDGEIGCLLSHLRLWIFIANNFSDDESFIIIEDDVVFSDENLDDILAYINEVKPSFSFLAPFPFSHSKKLIVARGYPAIALYGPRYLYTRTCAYLCSIGKVRELIDRALLAPFVADNWEWLLRQDRCILMDMFRHPEVNRSLIERDRFGVKSLKASIRIRYSRRFKIYMMRALMILVPLKFVRLDEALRLK